MPNLISFISLSIDGYFADAKSDMSWAHRPADPEFQAFVANNASGDGALLFGRKTYEMMASFWPTPAAAKNMPEVAAGMNRSVKYVASRTLDAATWNNTTILKGELTDEVHELKAGTGPNMAILGSGSVVLQLADAKLIDEYQVVVIPIALGSGRSFFGGMKEKLALTLTESRVFKNGNVFLRYRPS